MNKIMTKKGFNPADKEAMIMSDKLSILSASLPLHSSLFEKHRLDIIYKLIHNIVHTEISYHIRAIEELSPILALLE